jgi:hypothetical protein
MFFRCNARAIFLSDSKEIRLTNSLCIFVSKKNSLYIFLHSCPNPPSPSQIACAYETLPSRCLGFVALACRRSRVPMRSVLDYSPSQCGCASQRDRQSGSHQHTVLQDARARGMLRSLECKYVPRHAPVRRCSRGQVSGKSAT